MIYHRAECPYARKISDKHRRTVTVEQAKSRGYKECAWCGGIHGLYLDLRDHPEGHRKKMMEMMRLSYDSDNQAICFRTEVGFWKVFWSEDERAYKLWHLNHGHFSHKATDRQLMKRSFHRQVDVDPTKKIGKILQYIYDHDKAKKIIDKDWRKLPKSTAQQKRYYKQAKRREEKKSFRRVEELFKQLERERMGK